MLRGLKYSIFTAFFLRTYRDESNFFLYFMISHGLDGNGMNLIGFSESLKIVGVLNLDLFVLCLLPQNSIAYCKGRF